MKFNRRMAEGANLSQLQRLSGVWQKSAAVPLLLLRSLLCPLPDARCLMLAA